MKMKELYVWAILFPAGVYLAKWSNPQYSIGLLAIAGLLWLIFGTLLDIKEKLQKNEKNGNRFND